MKGVVRAHHEENANLLLSELQTAGFYRVFNLGDGIDRNNVDARFEHGVLTVKIFKTEEARSREISIN